MMSDTHISENDSSALSDGMPTELYAAVEYCLLLGDPQEKSICTQIVYSTLASLTREPDASPVLRIESPGIPDTPELIDPQLLERRGVGSVEGRITLLHALAHIEFNAINLALDAVYRFREMPQQYASDWLRVAADEARHFNLISDRLVALGSFYGAHDAHAGLWTMALKTDHDVLVRMALVPRVLEARGLDVAPAMIEKLRHAGDEQSASILDTIYHDEIEHVRIGNHWFLYLCHERDLKPAEVFATLLKQHSPGLLRGPYNTVARIQAGFTEEELLALKEIELEFRTGQ